MYKRILVPIDGSATSAKALNEAARLARLTGGRLRLLHVIDSLAQAYAAEPAPTAYVSELRPALLRVGEQLLAQAKADVDSPDLSIETEVHDSEGALVSEVIVARARHWQADLIVLGTHGRRGIERAMLGSDAEQVVRIAPVPVLLVRQSSAGRLT